MNRQKYSSSNHFKPPPAPKYRIKNFGNLWNSKGKPNFLSKTNKQLPSQFKRSKSLDFNTTPRSIDNKRNSNAKEFLWFGSSLHQLNDIEDKPSSIFSHNSRHFLRSLRQFQNKSPIRSDLTKYFKMSKELLDDFVRLKSEQFDFQFDTQPPNGEVNTVPNVLMANNTKNTPNLTDKINEISTIKTNTSCSTKKKSSRPKSATRRNVKFAGNSSQNNNSKSSNLNQPELGEHFDSDGENESADNYSESEMEEQLEPLFHRSLDKISSIANWEKQIRYELEIEKELQKRELDRQKEKLQNDQRKLEEWDKQLRIELDARERKLRLGEDELRSRQEEFNHKSSELMRREQMINDIVNERIKAEMKFEIEKLRKKFNELEIDKINLSKKEERVKEVEARLHEQVKIVKEKIDSKRLTDIELAKYRKELEIIKKENEVLKEKVDSMEDYQVAKFENRALKSELQILKESLESKNQELERDRERYEKEQRASDQKIMSLKGELRKAEHELVIHKQKAQGDLDEMSSKYEAVNGQVKRLQAFIKDHVAKLNYDFSATTQSLNQHFKQSQSFVGSKQTTSPNHHRHHSMYNPRNARHNSHHQYHHQRSVSMDGNDYRTKNSSVYGKNYPMRRSVSHARGCHLCNDDDEDDDLNNNHNGHKNGFNKFEDPIEDEENNRFISPYTTDEESQRNENGHNENAFSRKNDSNIEEDEVVRKIVNKIYEKMSHQVNKIYDHGNDFASNTIHEESRDIPTNGKQRFMTSIAEDGNNGIIDNDYNGHSNAVQYKTTEVQKVPHTQTLASNSKQIESISHLSTLGKGLSSPKHEYYDQENSHSSEFLYKSVPNGNVEHSTPVHRSLYEELLLASEVANPGPLISTSLSPKSNTIKNVINRSPLPNGPNNFVQPAQQLHNDSNNNMIGAISNKKNETSGTVVSHSADSRSSKSESFEIDW